MIRTAAEWKEIVEIYEESVSHALRRRRKGRERESDGGGRVWGKKINNRTWDKNHQNRK